MKACLIGLLLGLVLTIASPSQAEGYVQLLSDETVDGETFEGNGADEESAPAEDEPAPAGLPGSGDSNPLPTGDVTILRTATFEILEPPLAPIVDADLGESAAPDTTDGDEGSTSGSDNCLLYSAPEYNEEGDFYYSPVCIKWLVCGAERVDDLWTGRISGAEATGQYANFLGQMVSILGSDTYVAGEGFDDVDSINELLINGGLGDAEPVNGQIPVFYWCAGQDTNDIFDPVELWTTSFGWDLTIEDVYDVPGARGRLYAQLTAKLDLYDPEIGLVPPVEKGFTFVKWPTWFFLENPLEGEDVYTTNDIDTIRIDLRATLITVDWSFGDEIVASCTAAEMLKYDAVVHDPIDDLPACHYIFETVDTRNLTTTMNYKIEEKIRNVVASGGEYPDIGWSDYLNTPTVSNWTPHCPTTRSTKFT